jgi:hypothetical protein
MPTNSFKRQTLTAGVTANFDFAAWSPGVLVKNFTGGKIYVCEGEWSDTNNACIPDGGSQAFTADSRYNRAGSAQRWVVRTENTGSVEVDQLWQDTEI